MSRFADVKATERVELGPCQCPGTPHGVDYLDVRTQLGAEDAVALAKLYGTDDSIGALEILVSGWNLLDIDGSEAPVTRENLGRLFTDTFDVLEGWIEKHVRLTSLPNASAARSRSSSRASGSLTHRPKRAA